MRSTLLAPALCLALLASLPAAATLPSTNVAWQSAGADADIDRAFAQAAAERKPVLLYWGATWCPPCNQLKATLFNRQEFATLAQSFIAVHVDGDLPGAQKLGRRFKVGGYPTTVLFGPDGSEITRLPGEVDAPQALAVLQLGLAGGRPVKAVLADALAGRPLSAGEWRLLAFYSWDTDEEQLVRKAALPALLARLAARCPAADTEAATRLWIKALAASDDGQGVRPDAALRSRVAAVLADPVQSRLQMDGIVNNAGDIVRTLEPPGSAGRAAMVAAFDAALRRLQADASLSRADRVGALYARVELARIDQPKTSVHPLIPEPLLAELRERAARDDREITDGYERQAVITSDAAALSLAGLWAESDALLQGNLAKSHSPYYLMSELADNARKQGRNDDALHWYEEAYARSVGPATRLQWGAAYVSALVDLAPQDRARIEKSAAQWLAEAAADSGSFEGRSVRRLRRTGQKLVAWNARGREAPVLRRLQTQLDAICTKVDAAEGQRAACRSLLKPVPAKTAA